MENDIRFVNRPRCTIPNMNLMVNSRGQRIFAKTESFANRLLQMGYRYYSLDNCSVKPDYENVALVYRYRGGLGDLITCKPGIENMCKMWEHVILAIPLQYHFIFSDTPAYVVDYAHFFGKGKKGDAAYFKFIAKYALAVDLFCPAGIHETVTNFRPTKGRICIFSQLLEDPPYEPRIKLDTRHETMLPVIKTPVVGIQLVSECTNKDWPLENYHKLAILLKERGVTPLTFHQTFKFDDVESVTGLDLKSVAYVISKTCNVFMGPDSGLLHLANALGIPTVWLFGPTDMKTTLEFYPKAIGIQKIREDSCYRPCYYYIEHNGFHCGDNYGDCMKEISVEEVLEAVMKQLHSF